MLQLIIRFVEIATCALMNVAAITINNNFKLATAFKLILKPAFSLRL